MPNFFKSLTFLIPLIVIGESLYDEIPLYQFMGLNLTQNHLPYSMVLSHDEEKVVIHFLNRTTQLPQFKILRFDGTQRCRKRLTDQSLELIGWPKGQNLMFMNNSRKSLTILNTQCDDPVILANLTSKIKGVKYSSKDQESFVAVLTQQMKIYQYNLASKTIINEFKSDENEKLIGFEYSDNHRFMYIQTSQSGTYNESKIKIYEADSGHIFKEIYSEFMLAKVIDKGYSYLGLKQRNLYKVSIYDQKFTEIIDFKEQDNPLGFCTDENVLISIKAITKKIENQIQQKRNSIVVYDTSTGIVLQEIQIQYTPFQMKSNVMACNSQYLALMDQTGTIRIYKYSYPFPTIILVAFIVAGILVIAAIFAIVIMRRKNKQSEKYKNYTEQQENHTQNRIFLEDQS